MNHRNRKSNRLVALLVIGISAFFMGQVDYNRVENGRPPLFARWPISQSGDRTLEYYFLGYTVVVLDRFDGQQHTVGTKLDYWLPFFNRASTATIPTKSQLSPLPDQPDSANR